MTNLKFHRVFGALLWCLVLLSSLFLCGAQRAALAQTFTLTGSLNAARQLHHAVLLKNGKVLIVGGQGETALPTELYDAATGKFTTSGSPLVPRFLDTATLLQNGKVLIAGGLVFDTTDPNNPKFVTVTESELYDPATGKFTATGSLNIGRSSPDATLLANGKVLISGGSALANNNNLAFTNTAELYDPATGQFTVTNPMKVAREAHTATLLNNGKVLLAGGDSGAFGQEASAELYDPATNTFTLTGSLASGRTQHTATLLKNGKVLIAGGISGRDLAAGEAGPSVAELYDPATGTFNDTGSLPFLITNHTATLLNNGQVLFAGGQGDDGSSHASVPLREAELYDPSAGLFTATGSLNQARESHTATLLGNGKVLVAGGAITDPNDSTTTVPIASAELYSAGTTTTVGTINFGVSIEPKAPKTLDTITAIPQISDADKVGVSYLYAFSVNGVEKQSGSKSTFDLAPAGNGDKGDTISVVVTAQNPNAKGTATNFVKVVNSAPVVSNASGKVNEGQTVSIPVSATDADGDALTFKRVGGPRFGNGAFVTTGGVTNFVYTSVAHFNGTEAVKFVALDNTGKPSNVATISIAVSATPRPLNFGVTLRPFGPKSDTVLTAVPLIGDGNGVTYSYVWSVNGTVRPGETEQTLDLGKPGNGDRGDTVSVVVSGTRGADTGTATSNTVVVNSAPVANDANANGNAAAQISVPVSGSDADGGALTFQRVGGPNDGVGDFVTTNGQTRFVYRSRARFNGTDTIRFVATDDMGRTSVPATITINVTSTNPSIGFGVSLTPYGPKTNDTLTATPVITDASGITFSYAWSVNGVVIPNETTNTLDLGKPGNGDRGETVTAIVTAHQGDAFSVSRNSVVVANSAPVTSDASASGTSGAQISVPIASSDLDSDTLTFKSVGGPTNGTGSFVTTDGKTSFVYRSRSGFVGTETIRFVAADDSGRTSVPATITITVTASASSALRASSGASGGNS